MGRVSLGAGGAGGHLRPPARGAPGLLPARRAAESRPLPLGTRAGVCLRRVGRAPRVAGMVTHAAPRPRWNAQVRPGPEGTDGRNARAGALGLGVQP